jgi:hypothetical protein
MWKVFALSIVALVGMPIAQRSAPAESSWTMTFAVEADELASVGRNPYFILEPGYTLVLESKNERLTITVLDETLKIDGTDTRVVEEREMADGQLVEVSRNYYAISRRTNSVFYFGEDVNIYKGGKVVSHKGEWRAGRNGARFGLMMPGIVLLGAKYYQEIAPGVAMDRAEIVSLSQKVQTSSGSYENVLQVAETSPLEPRAREHKYYAAGVGLVQYGLLKVVNRKS